MPGFFPHAALDPREWQRWLAAAQAAEVAHRIMIAWLRSRLPAYPSLPAPQLAPGAPLTADESGHELLWTRDELKQGLQFRDPPTSIAESLQTPLHEQQRIVDGTRVLGLELENTSEWQNLGSATGGLDDPAREELRRARRTISEQLAEAEINEHGPQIGARSERRFAVLREALATLSGRAEEYARTFESANRLIEAAASDVFSQLVAYGKPAIVHSPKDIDIMPGSHGGLVSFTYITGRSEAQLPPDPGQLVRLDDPLVPDCVQITSHTYTFGPEGAKDRYTGLILSGTGEAWPC